MSMLVDLLPLLPEILQRSGSYWHMPPSCWMQQQLNLNGCVVVSGALWSRHGGHWWLPCSLWLSGARSGQDGDNSKPTMAGSIIYMAVCQVQTGLLPDVGGHELVPLQLKQMPASL